MRDLALFHGPNCQVLTSSSVAFSSTTPVLLFLTRMWGVPCSLWLWHCPPLPLLWLRQYGLIPWLFGSIIIWITGGFRLAIAGSHCLLSPCSPPCYPTCPSRGNATSQVLAAHFWLSVVPSRVVALKMSFPGALTEPLSLNDYYNKSDTFIFKIFIF